MSVPMVTCALCNSQITKRSSLLIEPYGRICRSHQEVESHKAKLAEIAKQNSENKKLEDGLKGLQVMMIVEQLRMMAYMSGHSLELTLLAFSYRLPKSIRAEVVDEVRERGPVTQKEAEEAAFMAAYMAMKGYFKADDLKNDLPMEVVEQDRPVEDLDQKVLPPSLCPEASADPLDGPVDNATMKGLFPDSPETSEAEISRPDSMLVEPKDFQNCWTYKYVVFADGKVLFCDASDMYASHKQIVDSGYFHSAVSAGTIKVKDGKWDIVESGSDTAKLPRGDDDEEIIAKELGSKWQHDPELMYRF